MAIRTSTRPRGGSGRWGKYAPRRRYCSFCANKTGNIDYKEVSLLSGYISDRGKIEPRRRTGTCARHQRALAMAIKRARHIALLPFAPEHIYKMGDAASQGTPKVAKETAKEAVKETTKEVAVEKEAPPVASVETTETEEKE